MTTNFKLHGKDLSLIFGTTTDITYQITPPSNYTNSDNTILNTVMKAESTIDYSQEPGTETISNIILNGDISIDPTLNPGLAYGFKPDRVFCDGYKTNGLPFTIDGVCPRYEEGTYPYTGTDGFEDSYSFSLDNTSDASHNNIKEVVVMVWGYGGMVGNPNLVGQTHEFACGGAGASGIFLTFKISSELLLDADPDHNTYIIQIKKPAGTGSFTHYVFIKKNISDDDNTYVTKIEIPKGGDGASATGSGNTVKGGVAGTMSTPICSGLGYVYNYTDQEMETKPQDGSWAQYLSRSDRYLEVIPPNFTHSYWNGKTVTNGVIPFQPKLVPYTTTPVSRNYNFKEAGLLPPQTASTNTLYGQGGYTHSMERKRDNPNNPFSSYKVYCYAYEAASSYFRIYFNPHGTSSSPS